MFIPKKIDQLKNSGGMLSYIMNFNTTSVQITNTGSKNVYLFKNSKLGIVQNYGKKIDI